MRNQRADHSGHGSGPGQEILDMFRAKYGARDVAAYYPKPNVAVDVPLS